MATEKIQIFRESNTGTIQNVINEWLAEHPSIEITQRLMTTDVRNACWGVIITIFYIEKPAKHAAKAAGAPRGRAKLAIAK